MDVGYRAGQSLTLVLLDWEKAFDKVDQEKMHEALERMIVPTKYTNIIRQIYKNPTFMIEIDGQRSGWKQQQTGIRQGCPLSPYLFLIVMTVMFHDIHNNEEHQKEMEDERILGAVFDEVLYADDTIIHSTDAKKVEKLLHKIEQEGENMVLNSIKTNVKH